MNQETGEMWYIIWNFYTHQYKIIHNLHFAEHYLQLNPFCVCVQVRL